MTSKTYYTLIEIQDPFLLHLNMNWILFVLVLLSNERNHSWGYHVYEFWYYNIVKTVNLLKSFPGVTVGQSEIKQMY